MNNANILCKVMNNSLIVKIAGGLSMGNSHRENIQHISWCTKYRVTVLKRKYASWVRAQLLRCCARYGVRVLSLAVLPDHVHLLVDVPPSLSVSRLVQCCKLWVTVHSSRWAIHLRKFGLETVVFQNGFSSKSISTGGPGHDLSKVTRYVNNQGLLF